jgi:hypothetical protein
MKGCKKRLLAFGFLSSVCASTWALPVFINEFHYDNVGRDVHEGIELVGLADTDLSGWSLLLYNGSDGAVYDNWSLSGRFSDQQNGYGALYFTGTRPIQNGPDAFALLDNLGAIQQFISYEGAITALSGAATGMESLDVGIGEGGTTPTGYSLQLSGSGSDWSEFAWVAGLASAGAINAGQTFLQEELAIDTELPLDDSLSSGNETVSVPEPGSLALFSLASLLLVSLRGKKV